MRRKLEKYYTDINGAEAANGDLKTSKPLSRSDKRKNANTDDGDASARNGRASAPKKRKVAPKKTMRKVEAQDEDDESVKESIEDYLMDNDYDAEQQLIGEQMNAQDSDEGFRMDSPVYKATNVDFGEI